MNVEVSRYLAVLVHGRRFMALPIELRLKKTSEWSTLDSVAAVDASWLTFWDSMVSTQRPRHSV
jgi:hypothetical protein